MSDLLSCSNFCTSILSPIWMIFGTLLSIPAGAAGRSWIGFISMRLACACFRKFGPFGGDIIHVLLIRVSPFVRFLFIGVALHIPMTSPYRMPFGTAFPYMQSQQVGILHVLSFTVLIHDHVVFPFIAPVLDIRIDVRCMPSLILIYIRYHSHIGLPGGSSRTVADILRGTGTEINDNVVARMMQRYSVEVSMALFTNDSGTMKSLYERAVALPNATTAAEMLAEGTGFVLDGVLFNGNDSLNVCFKEGVPHVLKVCTPTEYDRAIEWKKACVGMEPCPHIIGIETFCRRKDSGSKLFIFMPLHPITLEALPVMSATVLLRFYMQMSAALVFIHDAGFAHMDFKPANILITSGGDFILADLGSIVRFGEKSQSTSVYLPREMCGKGAARPIASASVDWWMMAVTVCEKACGYRAGLDTESAKKDRILDMLRTLGDRECDKAGDKKGDKEGDRQPESEGDKEEDKEGEKKGDRQADSDGDKEGDKEGARAKEIVASLLGRLGSLKK